MSIKLKLISLISAFLLVLGLIVVGVLAASSQTITMHGNVNFVVNDKSLYVKEVRMQEAGGEMEVISNFTPGYINGNFDFNVGDFENNRGSFALYFDIINTTTSSYTASVTVPESYAANNIEVETTGRIPASESEITTITSDTPISATLVLTVANPNLIDINLEDITININYEPKEYTGLTFNGNTFTGYTGEATELVIPSSYSIRESDGAFIEGNDYTVTRIIGSAYGSTIGATTIETLTIPSTVEIIGARAFQNCTNLVTVNGMEGVTHIFDYAFSGCSSLENISIPNGIVNIDYNVFRNCSALKYIVYNNLNYIGNTENPYLVLISEANSNLSTYTIHPNCKIINDNAFSGNTALTSIDIPEGVTLIGRGAFANCTGLQNISLPNSLQILRATFSGCTNLQYYTYEYGNYLGNSTNNYLALMSVTDKNQSTYNIHADCEIMMGSLFSQASSLTTLTLPSGVRYLGGNMFYYCNNLTSLFIPASVKIIDGYVTFFTGFDEVVIESPTNWMSCFDAGTDTRITIMDFSKNGSENVSMLRSNYLTYFEKLD